jgi:vitamin B12 transporter
VWAEEENQMITKWVLLCAIVVFPIAAFGQTFTVKGKVWDINGPVRSAEVTIRNEDTKLELTTTTDDEGKYRIDLPVAGSYSIIVSDPTIERGNRGSGQSVGVGGEFPSIQVVNFELPTISETVTVAAGTEQPVEQVSKTIDIIDSQQMRDRADFSLVESLRTIPGFRVQQFGGFGRVATIKTRGLRNQDTAILLDGIRFRDPTAITGDASPFLSDFTLTSVDSVEVLRGSGSSLYGTNAVGGVVDFRTPEAKSGTHGQIGGAFGGLGLGRFRGNISRGMDKFGISAGVSRTAYTKGIDGDDNAYNTNFQTRIDSNPFSKTSISGRIFVSDANVRLNSDPDTAGTLPASNAVIINAIPNVTFVPDIDDPDKIQHSKFFSGQIVVNQVVNSGLLMSGYYQGLTTKRTNVNGPLGIGFQSASTSIYDGTIHTANAHLNWTPNRINSFTAGYEFESERFGNDGRTPSGADNFFTRAGQKSNTLYAQDLISLLGGNLQFAGGARVQRYSLDRPEFSLVNPPYHDLTLSDPPTAYTFDGAASYFISRSGTKLRAHVGNGYRVPSLYERFGSFYSTFGPQPEFIIIGDPFLKPEKTIAFDAGIEQNLSHERLRLSATYFYTRLTDIITYGNVVPDIGMDPRPFGGYENQKGGIARGAEFSLKAKPTNSTDVFASYTFTNSDQSMPQVTGSGITRTLGVPDHQFTLVATQRFKKFWVNFDFLATSVYLAPIFDTNSFTFQTYIYRFNGNRKGDLTAGYTFGIKKEKMTMRVYGTVENIFDQEYYENGFRTAGATGRVGLSFGF